MAQLAQKLVENAGCGGTRVDNGIALMHAHPSVDTTDKPDGRGKNPRSLANLSPPWKEGESGGGHSVGGHQTARWRRAISAAVTEQDCIDVMAAMKERACGVEVAKPDKRTGELVVYSLPPDPNSARVFFEVLKVLGPDSAGVDLSTAPDDVVKWLAENGKGN